MLKYSVLSNFNKLIFIFIFNGGRKHNTSTKSRQCMFWPLKKQKIKKQHQWRMSIGLELFTITPKIPALCHIFRYMLPTKSQKHYGTS